MMNEIWTQKHTPQNLDDIVGNRDIIEYLNSTERAEDLNNMIFAGKSGLGKTCAALSLAHKLFKFNYKSNVLYINASDSKFQKNILDVKKDNILTVNINCNSFIDQHINKFLYKKRDGQKFLIIDEIDYISNSVQHSLLGIIEYFITKCKVIIICNNIDKISEAIRSKFMIMEFNSIEELDIVKRLKTILKLEGKTDWKKQGLRYIAKYCDKDMRKSINLLQMMIVAKKNINKKNVMDLILNIKTEQLENILFNCYNNNIKEAIKIGIELSNNGNHEIDIIMALYNICPDYEMFPNDFVKIKYLDVIGKYQKRILTGIKAKIQLNALIVELSQIENNNIQFS